MTSALDQLLNDFVAQGRMRLVGPERIRALLSRRGLSSRRVPQAKRRPLARACHYVKLEPNYLENKEISQEFVCDPVPGNRHGPAAILPVPFQSTVPQPMSEQKPHQFRPPLYHRRADEPCRRSRGEAEARGRGGGTNRREAGLGSVPQVADARRRASRRRSARRSTIPSTAGRAIRTGPTRSAKPGRSTRKLKPASSARLRGSPARRGLRGSLPRAEPSWSPSRRLQRRGGSCAVGAAAGAAIAAGDPIAPCPAGLPPRHLVDADASLGRAHVVLRVAQVATSGMSRLSRNRMSDLRDRASSCLTRFATMPSRPSERRTLATSSRSAMHLAVAWMSISEGMTGTRIASRRA